MRCSNWTYKEVPQVNVKPIENCLYKIGTQTFYILLPSLEASKGAEEGENSEKVLSSKASTMSTESERPTSRLLKEVQRKFEYRRTMLDQTLINSYIQDTNYSDVWDGRGQNSECYDDNENRGRWCKPAYIPTFLLLTLILLVVLLPLMDQSANASNFRDEPVVCEPTCRLQLVESIPIGLKFTEDSPKHVGTTETWQNLINSSTSSIDIASYYWTMKSSDVAPDPSSAEGDGIYEALKSAAKDRKIRLRIAQNAPGPYDEVTSDTEDLVKDGLAEVKSLNFTLLVSAGILHTKFWIVDQKHFYIGSANMDWRSLTQVKELGIVGYDCPCLAQDLNKIFLVYWAVGNQSELPDTWPDSLATSINMDSPAKLEVDGNEYNAFITSSPPVFSPKGRTDDIDAIVSSIRNAEKYINIAVMDYIPLMIYRPHVMFWSVIDDELRAAYIDRSVNVRLLISKWAHTRDDIYPFVRSLAALQDYNSKNTIEIKQFVVPTNSSFDHIPYSRVNHNKYMVTDKAALIGTSNWSGDYFVDTGGVSFVLSAYGNGTNSVNQPIYDQLLSVFERDWNSEFATPIN